MVRSTKALSLLACAAAIAMGSSFALAQTPPDRVLASIDDGQVVTLTGNVPRMAQPEFDHGAVPSETSLHRLLLLLQPSPGQQSSLDALVEGQQDPQSPLFRRWLTPAQYAARFGATPHDLARIADWLQQHGFTVEEIPAGNRLLIFSGTAGQVADTLHTELHRYLVDGEWHIANDQDPQIPSALAGVVAGIVSLHDFRRTAALAAHRPLGTFPPESGNRYMSPARFATIYDLNPLYSADTRGLGASIAIAGRSNIALSDVATFRSIFGLPVNSPTVILDGPSPGLSAGDEDEAILDVEWSGALAPAATVKLVAEASTETTDGADLAAQYIVNHATAQVIDTSFASCESDMGTTELAFYNSLWEQATSQGISPIVSSGNSGAAGCEPGSAKMGTAPGVNGLCTSAYATCVGGTEFQTTNQHAAPGYVPEDVWNESGASGSSGLWASGGGVSTVYSQPDWQQGVSGAGAANGMRAVPDVALAAATQSGYLTYENGSWWTSAGTSAASSSFAAILALLVQSNGGESQGSANSALYGLLSAAVDPFNPTEAGSNSVPGVAGFSAGGTPYNLATGLGSVDGALLIGQWNTTSVRRGRSDHGTAPASSSTTNSVFRSDQVSTHGGPGALPTIQLVAESTTLAVAQSSTTTDVFTLTGTGSFHGAIALNISALPSGVSASWTANPVMLSLPGTATVTLTLTTTASAPLNAQARFSVTAIARNAFMGLQGATRHRENTVPQGNQKRSVDLTASLICNIQVVEPPGVQIQISRAALTMPSAGSVQVAVTATPVGGVKIPAGATGASASVLSGLPPGFTASWSSPAITSSGAIKWTVTLTGSPTAVATSSTLDFSVQITDAASGLVYSAAQGMPLTVSLSPATLAVSLTNSQITMIQGASTTNVFTLAGGGSFNGPISLIVSGLPSGLSASWTANPVALPSTGTSSVTLTLTASATALVGNAMFTVSASGDGLTVIKNLHLQVQYAPAAQIRLSMWALTMQSAGTAALTVTAVPVGGVTVPAGAVGASAGVLSGLPTGFTASWSSPTLASTGAVSWTLTLTGSPTALAGSTSLNLSVQVTDAVSGSVYSASQGMTLTVDLSPPTLEVSPASTQIPVVQGTSVTDVFTLTGGGSFNGPIALSISGLPSSLSASWSTNPATLASTGPTTVTLTLTASAAAPVGSARLTVSASGDGLTVTKAVAAQVQYAPAVLIQVSRSTLSMQSAGTAALTVTAVPVGGVTVPAGAVGASAGVLSGLPTGFTASWSSPTLASTGAVSWTLTLTGSPTALAGSTSLNLSVQVTDAVSGSVYSASQGMTLTVELSPPTLGVSPASTQIPVVQGTSVTDVFTLTGGGSFNGPIALSISGLPSSLSASWSTNPATLASTGPTTVTLTLTASAAAPVGSARLTVSASGDGLTVTKAVAAQVQYAPAVLIQVSRSTLSMQSAGTAALTVTAVPVGGVTVPAGAVGASASVLSGLPPGFTASWSSPTLASTGAVSWTLTLTGSPTALAGSTSLNLSVQVTDAVSGSVYSASQGMTLTVDLSPPTLAVSLASSQVSLVQGTAATDVLTFAAGGSFNGPIALTVSGLPAGLSASWTANPVTLSSQEFASITMTLTANSAALVGSAMVIVSASGDGLTVNRTLNVHLQQGPAVAILLSPSTLSMQSMNTAVITVTAIPLGGVKVPLGATGAAVAIVSGLPTGFTAAWGAPSITSYGAVQWTLTLAGSSMAVATSAPLVLSAQLTDAVSGSVYSTSQTLPLNVSLTPPTLSFMPALGQLVLVQGSTVANVFTLIGGGSFNGTINLNVSGLPAGVSATWNTNPIALVSGTATAILTLTASAEAPVGAVNIVVTASGEGLTVAQQIGVQVQSSNAIQTQLSQLALTMPASGTNTLTIAVSPASGMSSSVSVGSPPSGVSMALGSLSQSGANGTSIVLTLSGSPFASTGTYMIPITITMTDAAGASTTSWTALTLTLD